jgi:hypothetical protein
MSRDSRCITRQAASARTLFDDASGHAWTCFLVQVDEWPPDDLRNVSTILRQPVSEFKLYYLVAAADLSKRRLVCVAVLAAF